MVPPHPSPGVTERRGCAAAGWDAATRSLIPCSVLSRKRSQQSLGTSSSSNQRRRRRRRRLKSPSPVQKRTGERERANRKTEGPRKTRKFQTTDSIRQGWGMGEMAVSGAAGRGHGVRRFGKSKENFGHFLESAKESNGVNGGRTHERRGAGDRRRPRGSARCSILSR